MPTFKIVLYKQKTLSDGTHPVMLQVVENERPFRISLGYKCTSEQWDFGAGKFKKNMHEHVLKNGTLRKQLDKAESIVDNLRKQEKPFTPAIFKDLFTGIERTATVIEFLDELLEEFDKRGQVSTRSIYKTLKSRLIKFWGKRRLLMFPDIDYQFLKKFETFLFGLGCSGGGVDHYMRTIRAMYNEAIVRKYVDEKLYPFSTARNKNGYSLSHLKSNASPRALSLADMEKIKHFPIEAYPHLKQSHLYFLFSYYARGINFHDMARLKWKDLYDGRIHYTRQKTGGFFSINISENIQNILEQFPKTTSGYVFPILDDFHQTEKQIRYRIQKCLKKLNLELREITQILEIPVTVTSYVARHTFASTLKRKNANVDKISEAMGHADIATTKAYLKNFENSELDALDELL